MEKIKFKIKCELEFDSENKKVAKREIEHLIYILDNLYKTKLIIKEKI